MPDPAGLAQSNPVLGFSGWRLYRGDVVEESFVEVVEKQWREVGVKRMAVVDGG